MPAPSKSPYEVLGVPPQASKDDIKRAYKKLAVLHHPDKGGDSETFKDISRAYEILSDDDKRASYDRFGDADEHQHQHQSSSMANNIFEHMFGNAMFNQSRADVMHRLNITLAEAYTGVTKNMRITVERLCTQCKQRCVACNGAGKLTQLRQMGPFTHMVNTPCTMCNGSGQKSTGCKACNQSGKTKDEKALEIRIPAGAQSGDRTIHQGLGEQPNSPNEQAGNLIFEVFVLPHSKFERNGHDLIHTAVITFAQSIVGTTVKIPHFTGEILFNTKTIGIVQPRKQYIASDLGMPVPDSQRKGKVIVVFDIQYPTCKAMDDSVCEELLKLLEKL